MREAHCEYCGEPLGYDRRAGDPPDHCGKPECAREVRDMERQADAEARERAEEDGYSLYGGRRW
jgi:hypothetical protein